MSRHFTDISKISDALISFFESASDRERLLEQVSSISEYLEKHDDISLFFTEYGQKIEHKKEVLEVMLKAFKPSEWLENTLHILVDRNLSFYISLFLSTTKSKLLKLLGIQNIYIYSSHNIVESQKKRIEELWKERVKKNCNFFYAIDDSLRMGVKVQVDTYIEEYSLSANLENLKLKLDSILI